MSKHSPGPWKWRYGRLIRDDGAATPVLMATDGRDGFADRCYVTCDDPGDAALIASAPTIAADLAEAVGLLRRINEEDWLMGTDCGDAVKALLARIDAGKTA